MWCYVTFGPDDSPEPYSTQLHRIAAIDGEGIVRIEPPVVVPHVDGDGKPYTQPVARFATVSWIEIHPAISIGWSLVSVPQCGVEELVDSPDSESGVL
jgi:hypothetical protein